MAVVCTAVSLPMMQRLDLSIVFFFRSSITMLSERVGEELTAAEEEEGEAVDVVVLISLTVT